MVNNSKRALILPGAVAKSPLKGVAFAAGIRRGRPKKMVARLTHQEGIMNKATWPDFPIRYAPYTPANLKWIKRLT